MATRGGAAARALAVCDLGTRQVPELALQRGDRHRVQANKPNTTFIDSITKLYIGSLQI